MKALTISQPFASLIARGEKWVENRTWATPHRGPLAIHAGKGTQYLTPEELKAYPTGAVIAIADLVACVHRPSVQHRLFESCEQLLLAGIGPKEFLDHPHTEGPWCWVLRDVRPIDPPVPARGQQGLWEWVCPLVVETQTQEERT